MKTQETKKFNVYEEVTNRIITELEKGSMPWRQPWNKPENKDLINYVSEKPYQGINRILLGLFHGKQGEFLTFNQAKNCNGNIKKGEKGTPIVKFGTFIPKDKKQEAEKLKNAGLSTSHLELPYWKHDWVFSLKQTENIQSKFTEQVEHKQAEKPTDICDYIINKYLKNNHITIKTHLLPDLDIENKTILIPEKTQFTYEEDYYNTLLNLICKSTSFFINDLKRNIKDSQIEKEELICELSSSMIFNAVEFNRKETQDNQIALCNKWISILKENKSYILNCSSPSEKITKYILKPIYG